MVIEIGHACKSFGTQKVLDDVTFSVARGERLIVCGQNGAGKTTLLRAMLGLYRLDAGTVRILGLDPARQRKEALAKVAFIPQLPPPLPFSLKVLLDYAHRTAATDTGEVLAFCRRFGLDVERHLAKPFDRLSGGMKQKVLAGLAFARHAPVMFFDEPTANLDSDGRRTFADIIRGGEFADTTMIFISHRIEELDAVLNRALWLDFGRIVKDEKLA